MAGKKKTRAEIEKEANKTHTDAKSAERLGLPSADEVPEDEKTAAFRAMITSPYSASAERANRAIQGRAQQASESMNILYEHFDGVIYKLLDLAFNSKSESVQLKALLSICDRILGKPVESKQDDATVNRDERIVSLVEDVDVEQLRRLISGKSGGGK